MWVHSEGNEGRKKTERKDWGISKRHRNPPDKAPNGPSWKKLSKKQITIALNSDAKTHIHESIQL